MGDVGADVVLAAGAKVSREKKCICMGVRSGELLRKLIFSFLVVIAAVERVTW